MININLLEKDANYLSINKKFKKITNSDTMDVLFINNDEGDWFIVEKQYVAFIDSIIKGKVIESWSSLHSQEKELLKSLYNEQLLTINNQYYCHNDIDNNHSKLSNNISLIIIEPCEYCNLSCKYCFEKNPSNGNKMTLEIASKIIKIIPTLNLDDSFVVEFNGGEPLLNFEIIKFIVNTIKEDIKGNTISFAIQTSGTVMDNSIAQFFSENNFSVGISLDGPKHIHDANRIFNNGKGTYEVIMRNLKILDDYKINYGFLSVISEPNNIPEIYNFFTGILNKKNMKLNLIRTGGKNSVLTTEKLSKEMGEQHYMAFKNSLDTFKREGIKIQLQNVNHMLHNIILYDTPYMCMKSPCGAGVNQISFEYNGNILPCQDFKNKKEFSVANLADNDISKKITNSKIIKKMQKRKVDDNHDCSKCSWKKFCQGGCYSTCYFGSEENFHESLKAKTPQCEYFKFMFSHLIWDIYYNKDIIIDYAF